MTQNNDDPAIWVPDACTLPTADRPLRIARFDGLFATGVTGLQRSAPDLARFDLRPDPAVAATAMDLCVRETACCSFFEFTLVATDGRVRMDVRTPPEHTDVLDAVVARARAAVAGAGG